MKVVEDLVHVAPELIELLEAAEEFAKYQEVNSVTSNLLQVDWPPATMWLNTQHPLGLTVYGGAAHGLLGPGSQ